MSSELKGLDVEAQMWTLNQKHGVWAREVYSSAQETRLYVISVGRLARTFSGRTWKGALKAYTKHTASKLN